MRILVVCQYYWPEPFRISAVCERLAARGHEVTVITGEPNYPEGRIYPGYENHAKADETLNGVRVVRCPVIPRKTGVLFRVLNYYSFVFSAKRRIKRDDVKCGDGGDFDVVFVNQLSPVMMALPAFTYRKKHGAPVALYCLDLWPESLIAGGVKRGSFLHRIFRGVSERIYRRSDRIFVTSRFFRDYLAKEFGIPAERIDYLPQYAEGIFGGVPEKQPEGELKILFAGNVGAAQSLDTVLEAAKLLLSRPVRFIIAGGGSELERLAEKASHLGLDNVEFRGRLPLESMPALYKEADAMLITLRKDPILSRTLPGKMQSYMAAGRPVIGAIDGEAAEVINAAGCGFCGEAEDAKALAANVERFIESPDKAAMGKNARAYYEENFEEGRFMEKLLSGLALLTGERK